MEKYKIGTVCPKCDSGVLKIEYQKQGNLLRLDCPKCSYWWSMLPVDYEEKEL